MEFFNKLKALDAYPKINEDFYSRTLSGGIITLISSIVMLLLFISELNTALALEAGSIKDGWPVVLAGLQLDIVFPKLSCSMLSLDAMDISGEQHLDVVHNIFKRRLDPTGTPIDGSGIKHEVGEDKHLKGPHKVGDAEGAGTNSTFCGSCFGAEQCCSHSAEERAPPPQCSREGYLQQIKDQEGEGCNVYGFLEVNKVAGNFHFAPGKSFQQANMHVHDLMPFADKNFNPGPPGMYQYFTKVVPTVYTDLRGHVISTNQFSVTEHFKPSEGMTGRTLPGVFIFYDLSPIKVKYTEERTSFLHFLTNVCAIVGGVFTVTGMIDAFVYHGHKAIKKKMELGKLS
eukprot:jgi/Mesen1/6075/ME000031S05341